MNENINLCEILKGHEDETFYCLIYGYVKLKFITKKNVIVETSLYRLYLNQSGKIVHEGEILLFPSKDQRDWNKWVNEQKSKVPKTWSEYTKIIPPKTANDYKDYPFAVQNIVFNRKDVTPIEKSALALIKIHQLIEVGYGGNITKEEWKSSCKKYIIKYHSDIKSLNVIITVYHVAHIAFHNKRQAEEFLKYSENVQLLKDYFMVS